jgi:integrase
MENRLKILFWLWKSKENDKGLAPIYMRLTIAGDRAEVATGYFTNISKWDVTKGIVRGKGDEVNEINQGLLALKSKTLKTFNSLSEEGGFFSAETIKLKLLGKDKQRKSLIEVVNWHIKRIKEQIGKEYSLGTYKRYITIQNKLEKFLKVKYKRTDILLSEITINFISDFEYFLKMSENVSHNTVCKYLVLFKRFINVSLTYGWIERNPFAGYKIMTKEKERGFLTATEVSLMYSKKLTIKRVEQVRDIFVFCCYTGLAYADVKKLAKEDVQIGVDGERWIITNRTKTDRRSAIPLLPIALELIEKYKDNFEKENKVFPVLSNQRMNAYLKEVADICGIEKLLTFHLARHTFATTITLTNGVPIETVSKMLGHTSIRTTQIYAKVIDAKIGSDMNRLREQLS